MKHLALIFSLFFLETFTIYSQDMLDTLARETCACIGAKTLDGMRQEAINLELGDCIIESFTRHSEASQALNVNIYDADGMRQLNEKIRKRMEEICPDMIAKMASKDEINSEAANQLEGTIVRLEGNEFGFVVIRDGQGREHKLLWLRYFKNSERLNDPRNVLGKRVRIVYEPIECYSPAEHEYFERKEIKAIEFL